MMPKVRERWQKEVEIMLKLNHRWVMSPGSNSRCSGLPSIFGRAGKYLKLVDCPQMDSWSLYRKTDEIMS